MTKPKAIANAPVVTDTLRRATAFHQRGQFEEAEALYRQALQRQPRNFEAMHLFGVMMHQRGMHLEALALIREALKIDALSAAAYFNQAVVLAALKRPDEALASYDRAIALKPDYAEALNGRGNLQLKLGRSTEALESYQQALAIKPGFIDATINCVKVLRLLGREADAADVYARALAIDPNRVEIWIALGNTLGRLQRHDDALRCFDRALALDPALAEAHCDKGLAQLRHGDFVHGFANYEWRWRCAGAAKRDFGVPQWRGEDLSGKTILVHAEQDVGDMIQFVRYVPMLDARGATIVLEVPRSLMPLLGDIDGVTAMIGRGEPHPPIDLHCPLMSLPFAFGTTLAAIPAALPYLHAPAERVAAWRARLPARGKLRVGLVWSGKPPHRKDRSRELDFERLAPVLAQSNVEFVSLQREVRAADKMALHKAAVLRPDLRHADFADIAALIETLDLVIAVDSAVAHLTGALAKPVWLLLPFGPDWRWMLDRDDSPWYPGARLFRQPGIGDWGSVVQRLGEALASLAATRQTPDSYIYL